MKIAAAEGIAESLENPTKEMIVPDAFDKAVVENLSWVSGNMPKLPTKCLAKIRRLHPEATCVIKKKGKLAPTAFIS